MAIMSWEGKANTYLYTMSGSYVGSEITKYGFEGAAIAMHCQYRGTICEGYFLYPCGTYV